MSEKRLFTRREFLRLSASAAVGAVWAAWAGPVAAQGGAPPAGESGGTYQEAPELAGLVAQGELLPVEERLPENPCICPVMERTGRYGGTIRRGFRDFLSDRLGPTKMRNESLIWYNADLSLRPNLCESWEVNTDASEWTFHLRQGTRWSDGVPFDSESFQWWYEYQLSSRLFSSVLDWSGGSPEMEFPDMYTIRFKFDAPQPLFAFTVTRQWPFDAGHYMSQFHIETTDDPEALEQEARDAGFESWEEFFRDRDTWYLNPDKPDLGPWVARNSLDSECFLMERNPYFWQVDEEGRQLPYTDMVIHQQFESIAQFNQWVIAGEIDFQSRHVSPGNLDLFEANQAVGDYRVVVGARCNDLALQPNHTTKELRLREFFQNQDVRLALSLAVDRGAINAEIYSERLTPRQYSPLSTSPQYYPDQAFAHIAYNPSQADQLLDAAGYTARDDEGFRVWKDGSGETLSFEIIGFDEPGIPEEQAVQRVVEYFAAVGVRASYQYLPRTLYTERYLSNDVEAAFCGGDRTVLPLADPCIFIGTQPDRPWSCAWAWWWRDHEHPNGEQPPDEHWIWDLWALWDQIEVEPQETQRNQLFFQILDIWKEQLPMIGFLGEAPQPVIVKNGLRNYVAGYPLDDTTEDEHLLNPQTLFWVATAAVDFDPDVLNVKSKGRWVTAYIQPLGDFDAEDIVVSTVMLDGVIPAKGHPTCVADHNGDGVAELMVKFDRQALIAHLGGRTGEVTLTVSGDLVDGSAFEGDGTITVIKPGK